MKSVSIVISAILCISFWGCENRLTKSLRNFRDQVDNTVATSFLSMDLLATDSVSILHPGIMEYSGYCGVFVCRTLSAADYKKDSIRYFTKPLLISDLKDSCNLYIGDSIAVPDCHRRIVPVPGLVNKFSPVDQFGIRDESMYLVSEYRSGYFFKEQYEIKDILMPEDFKHGYSSGVILPNNGSSRKVIYWLIIW